MGESSSLPLLPAPGLPGEAWRGEESPPPTEVYTCKNTQVIINNFCFLGGSPPHILLVYSEICAAITTVISGTFVSPHKEILCPLEIAPLFLHPSQP